MHFYSIFRLMDFFPPKKQTEEYLKSVFVEKGLAEVVKLHKNQASQEAKRELTQVIIILQIPCLHNCFCTWKTFRSSDKFLVEMFAIKLRFLKCQINIKFFACIFLCITKRQMSMKTLQFNIKNVQFFFQFIVMCNILIKYNSFIFNFQILIDDINDNKSHKEIISDIRDLAQKTNIADHEIIGLIWTTVMSLPEWNKKEELVADQAIKHLKQYTQLFVAFATNERAELALILKVQEFCYENMNFMKAFQKIVVLFYKSKYFYPKI